MTTEQKVDVAFLDAHIKAKRCELAQSKALAKGLEREIYRLECLLAKSKREEKPALMDDVAEATKRWRQWKKSHGRAEKETEE
jgi:septal ring factor EnvC (AmiA/AmiB activator)